MISTELKVKIGSALGAGMVALGFLTPVLSHAQAVTIDPTTEANINAGVGSLGTIAVGEMVAILPFIWPVLAVLIAISVAIGFFMRHSGVHK